MADPGQFKDYDEDHVYQQSQTLAVDPKTMNFIVDFGKDSARIAFDSDAEDVKGLLDSSSRAPERPIRWMYDISYCGIYIGRKLIDQSQQRMGTQSSSGSYRSHRPPL